MLQLQPHQEQAIEKLSNGKILWGGVGVGKSITAAAYYLRKEAPKDIYVITTAKKRDSVEWEGEFAKIAVGKTPESTVAGVLHVDSWNNIDKYVKVANAFFIFDEQRLVGSGAWVKAFIKIAKNNRWIMLSATPGDIWMDYVPVFIANGFYKNREEFKQEHVVYKTYSKFPKIVRYNGLGRLVRHRNDVLVEMPYLRHTVRHSFDIEVEHDETLLSVVVKRKWNPFLNRPLRDVAELFMTMRKVVNSHPSRLDAVKKLWDVHPRLIVFYNFDYELEALRTLGNVESESWQIPKHADTTSSRRSSETTSLLLSSVAAAEQTSVNQRNELERTTCGTKTTAAGSTSLLREWNGHKHEAIPEGDRWLYLVQYTAGSEGWNCTATDAMVFYSLTYSYKQYEQGKGRIDRLNTPYKELFYYTLKSRAEIDEAIAKSLKMKKNFNESNFTLGGSRAKRT